MSRSLFCFALLVALVSAATPAMAGTYQFDSGADGWVQSRIGYNSGSYETLHPNSTASWTGDFGAGTPDGSIYQSSSGWEGRAYWLGVRDVTASTSLGDLTNRTIEAEIRSTANWTGRVSTDTVYARWTIAVEDAAHTMTSMWVSKAAVSIDLNSGLFGSGTDADWLLQSIEMIEANFFKWPVGTADPKVTFANALQNYTSIGLAILPTASGSDSLGNFDGSTGTWGSDSTLLHYGATAATGTATWGVDNFSVVPLPSAVLAGGVLLGGLGLLRRFRRAP